MSEPTKHNLESSYRTSFLTIKLSTGQNILKLCRDKMDDYVEANFLHEYIHYLQDLTTTTGLSRIIINLNQFLYARLQLDKDKHTIKVPVDIKQCEGYNLSFDAGTLEICEGDGQWKNAVIDEYQSFDLFNSYILNKTTRHEAKIIAQLKFRQGETNCIYRVGEYAISESMAYILERHIYPNAITDPPVFPYKVVQTICNHELCEELSDECLIALCDACLMHPFPGKALYSFIDSHRTSKGMSPEFIWKDLTSRENFTDEEDWQDIYKRELQKAKKQFLEYFENPYLQDMKLIVEMTFDAAMKFRLQHILYPVDIAKSGEINKNAPFLNAVSLIGCLCVHTFDENLYNFPNRAYEEANIKDKQIPQIDVMYSLWQLYSILLRENTLSSDCTMSCELKTYCKNSFSKKGERDLTSEGYGCIYEPWSRAKDPDWNQCSFGRIWAVNGLMGISPIV